LDIPQPLWCGLAGGVGWKIYPFWSPLNAWEGGGEGGKRSRGIITPQSRLSKGVMTLPKPKQQNNQQGNQPTLPNSCHYMYSYDYLTLLLLH